jgi:hypothetical protein
LALPITKTIRHGRGLAAALAGHLPQRDEILHHPAGLDLGSQTQIRSV